MFSVPMMTSHGEQNICSFPNCALGQQEDQQGDGKCPQDLHRKVEQLYRLSQTWCQEKAAPHLCHDQALARANSVKQLSECMSIQKRSNEAMQRWQGQRCEDEF